MKIKVLSDLHLESGQLENVENDFDVVVLAGDIHTKKNGLLWAKKVFKDIPILYVLGNHEFYGGAYPKLISTLKDEAVGSNVHILENDVVTIDGVNFLGCTLWTDFKLLGHDQRLTGSECQEKMNDYRKIRVTPSYYKLRSLDVAIINQISVRWLEKELKARQDENNIVITHHAPSLKSIPEEYQNDIISSAYASNLDDLIEKYQPSYWIHGHIHESVNYKIGDCSVVSNPRGYKSELNENFDSNFIIELEVDQKYVHGQPKL